MICCLIRLIKLRISLGIQNVRINAKSFENLFTLLKRPLPLVDAEVTFAIDEAIKHFLIFICYACTFFLHWLRVHASDATWSYNTFVIGLFKRALTILNCCLDGGSVIILHDFVHVV